MSLREFSLNSYNFEVVVFKTAHNKVHIFVEFLALDLVAAQLTKALEVEHVYGNSVISETYHCHLLF